MRVNTKKLSDYIKTDEVVFQRFGELMEISNNDNDENRKLLIKDLESSSCVEAYTKGNSYISEDFKELNNWATSDDSLLLFQIVGTLVCIPSKILVDKEILIN